MTFQVLIIGGGIGGLTLAQGLRRAGIAAAVYERDRTRNDRLQGYRIHINPAGCRALHECLPPELYASFVASSGMPNTTFGFYTHRLERLLVLGDMDAAEHYVDSYRSVSRITLRQLLLTGLDDIVHYDKTFERYENLPDGRVRAHFEDGTTADGDLLVAADGSNSRVRQQYLPNAPRLDTGALAIAGKVPLDDQTRSLLPAQMFAGSGFLVGPPGQSMFIAVHEFRNRRRPVTGPSGGLLMDDTADYIMWNLVTTWDRLGGRATIEAMDGAGLQHLALSTIAPWHPKLHDLIHRSDLGSISVLPLRSSTPVTHWTPSAVTLIGDAIHNMPPTAGVGANTAIRDAHLLCRNLVAVTAGGRSLLDAVGDYETAMRDYGFKAVATAMRNLRMTVSGSASGRFVTRGVLRLLDAVPLVRRQLSTAMTK